MKIILSKHAKNKIIVGKNRIKIWFDENEDILYVSFGKGKAIDSEEKEDGVRVEYNKEGKIIGIEIAEITKRLVKPLARKLITAVK